MDEDFRVWRWANIAAVQLYADNQDVQHTIRLHLRSPHAGEQVKVFAY